MTHNTELCATSYKELLEREEKAASVSKAIRSSYLEEWFNTYKELLEREEEEHGLPSTSQTDYR